MSYDDIFGDYPEEEVVAPSLTPDELR